MIRNTNLARFCRCLLLDCAVVSVAWVQALQLVLQGTQVFVALANKTSCTSALSLFKFSQKLSVCMVSSCRSSSPRELRFFGVREPKRTCRYEENRA